MIAANSETERERSRTYYAANRDQVRERARARHMANPEKLRERKRAYYAANRQNILDSHLAWRTANTDKVRQMAAAYRAANREQVQNRSQEWRIANPGAASAIVSKRRAFKLAQRCTCCTDADIKKIYDIAALCGSGSHVDHKIQLSLGGRHCIKNLEAMTVDAHIEKSKLDASARADVRRRNTLLRNWATKWS